MSKIKIIFFGSPKFSLPSLKTLHEDQRITVAAVFTKPGTPIHNLAKRYNLPTFTPKNKTELETQAQKLADKDIDLGMVVAYGLVIPKEVLALPKHGCLALHPSLLPALRGPSPIRTAILENHEKTGVTVFKMDQKVDHGPILAQKEISLSPTHTYVTLSRQLANVGASLLKETLFPYIQGKIKPQPQEHEKATFTKLWKREDGKIPWDKGDEYIERMVRALNPWPGTWTTMAELCSATDQTLEIRDQRQKEKRVKILEAHLDDQGKLVIDKLQVEGKQPITFSEFKRGYLTPLPTSPSLP